METVEMDVLHSLHGDKKRKFDTTTEEGRAETEKNITKMIRSGTAIFLERGKKTYRITAYDAKKDRFVVRTDTGESVGADPKKGRKTAVAPSAGG